MNDSGFSNHRKVDYVSGAGDPGDRARVERERVRDPILDRDLDQMERAWRLLEGAEPAGLPAGVEERLQVRVEELLARKERGRALTHPRVLAASCVIMLIALCFLLRDRQALRPPGREGDREEGVRAEDSTVGTALDLVRGPVIHQSGREASGLPRWIGQGPARMVEETREIPEPSPWAGVPAQPLRGEAE